jgi:hypothetical protein
MNTTETVQEIIVNILRNTAKEMNQPLVVMVTIIKDMMIIKGLTETKKETIDMKENTDLETKIVIETLTTIEKIPFKTPVRQPLKDLVIKHLVSKNPARRMESLWIPFISLDYLQPLLKHLWPSFLVQLGSLKYFNLIRKINVPKNLKFGYTKIRLLDNLKEMLQLLMMIQLLLTAP